MTDKPPSPAAPPPGPLAQPPRKSRTSLIIIGSAAAIIAAVVATGIIVVHARNDGQNPNASASRSTPSGATRSAAEEEQPAPQSTEPKVKGLQDKAAYASGVTVSLSDYQRGASSANAAPANTAYTSFTVKIENKSPSALDLSAAYLMCFHGEESQESQQIFDEELHGLPELRLQPGRAAKATVACEMPKEETYLQVEFTLSQDLPKTVFAGDVA